MKCNLCQAKTVSFYSGRHGEYFRCSQCKGISLSPEFFLSPQAEKERYETHNNDVTDVRYQQFVAPIVDEILQSFSKYHHGLDFGCGTGPVIQYLLEQQGFSVQLYDPFFKKKPAVLSQTYDFIICCEVIEHFHHVAKEFSTLLNLLKPHGKLYCMTDFFDESISFKDWYYKDDPTHVFFYHTESLYYLQQKIGFSGLQIKNRLAIFEK